jgi:hypothetical protein
MTITNFVTLGRCSKKTAYNTVSKAQSGWHRAERRWAIFPEGELSGALSVDESARATVRPAGRA